jgi:hypothetical protein
MSEATSGGFPLLIPATLRFGREAVIANLPSLLMIEVSASFVKTQIAM